MTVGWVAGRGFWSPGYPDLEAWLEKRPVDDATRPPGGTVPSRLMRGTSLLTRMLVEVTMQAAREADLDLGRVATVFASRDGEIQTAVDQLEMMHDEEGLLSPTRFHHSVHNTAAGIVSIATGNNGFTTALAGTDSFSVALLEAVALLRAGESAVVIAAADELVPEPLPSKSQTPLGVALALVASRPARSWAQLRAPYRGADIASPLHVHFGSHPASCGLQVLEAISHANQSAVSHAGWLFSFDVGEQSQ